MKPYFRMSVDRLKGKWTEHTVDFTSRSHPRRGHSDTVEEIVRADHGFVDEVVINDWFHLEAMSRRQYWMNIAGVTVWVNLRKDGSVKSVEVFGPGEYDHPRKNVTYVMGGR